MATKIQVRRDAAADWTSTNPTLAAGEIGFESDTNKFKIGDGATAWTSLAYAPQDYITGSSTTTFTNKTFDANGTGNSISNIETADIAAATLVTAAEGIGSNNNDTTLPTSAAVKAYADSVGGASTGDITFTGSTINSPSNADITLNPGGTGDVVMPAISFQDNLITTNRSNDNLNIEANGTGQVELGAPFDQINTNTRYDYGVNMAYVNNSYAGNTRTWVNNQGHKHTLTQAGGSSFEINSENRAQLEMAGFDATAGTRFFTSKQYNMVVSNDSSATAATLNNARALYSGIAASTSNGNLTLSDARGNWSYIAGEPATGKTATITNSYNYYAQPLFDFGEGGTTSGTNAYGFYFASGSLATNTYAFYDASNSLSVFGDIQTQAVSITDNEITTNRSNDDLNISANGTGRVQIAGAGTFATGIGSGERNVLYHKDHAQTFGSRSYANLIEQDIKIDAGELDSSSTNDRYRNIMNVNLDLNGKDSTASSTFITRGPNNFVSVQPSNSGTGDSILGNAAANNNFIFASTSNTGDLTISLMASNTASVEMSANTGSTVTFTDARIYNSNAEAYNGGGTENIGTLYHFKANAAVNFDSITNEYGVHTPDSMQSLIGGVTLQNGDVTTGAITLSDNHITANRSNDDLVLETNGTGYVQISANGGDFSNYSTLSRYNNGNILLYQDLSDTLADDRNYRNVIIQDIKLTSGQNSSSSNDRWRNLGITKLDLNGSSSTATSASYRSRGPMGLEALAIVQNSTSTAATLGNASGGNYGVALYPGGTGNITLTGTTCMGTFFEIEQLDGNITVTDHVAFESIGLDRYVGATGSPGNTTITDVYHFRAGANSASGGGTTTLTNNYAFYAEADTVATNKYAFYSSSDTAKSRVGSLERYRETINALTSSSTITVDCGLAPVHTVTLGTNTEFNISNLGTGQSVTIIITQDGIGSRTATFGTDGSTAVKFAGGTKTLSTAASAIDVVTIFNDGTNFIGNLATAYAA